MLFRSVFGVMSRSSGNKGNILSTDSTVNTYNFFTDSSKFFHTSHASGYVRNGLLRVNGTAQNGTTTDIPSSLFIYSIRTTGNVEANQIGQDRVFTGRYSFDGDYGELIIFNSPLSDTKIEEIESYLAIKWGLTSSFPSNHPCQPIKGADLTLYWGSSDGGTNPGSWENNVIIGKKKIGRAHV